ncbi:MAG: peptidylprolyl isomerase [Candidatus Aenigmarchaeota archaeon]|nr:peptidylprolyl isomerase [Candidatus Aenigmarchaeota archaeon]
MALSKGDFLEIDFTGRIASSMEVFDTSLEQVARDGKVFKDDYRYGPVLVIVGAGMVVKGLEQRLMAMETGQETTFTLQPEQAFGPRHAGLVRLVPEAKFHEKKIEPYPGLFVDIDDMPAKVMSVASGRVRIDFNHPLAGRELHYWVKVIRKLEQPREKLEGLLRHYGVDGAVKAYGSKLTITLDLPDKLPNNVREAITGTIKRDAAKWLPDMTLEFPERAPPAAASAGKVEAPQPTP